MTWDLQIRNIAGIREGETSLKPGLNAVRGANWQGKSSFLRAIETAMGTETSLTEGETEGWVDLATPEETAHVELARRNGSVVKSGEPLLHSDYTRTCASRYAFLDEDNEVRRAVRTGENLEEPLTRPLDFENIDEQIGDRKAERRQVEAELERAEDAAAELPSVEEKVTRLDVKLSELESERDELAEADDGDDDGRGELTDLRAERDRLEQRVQRLEDAIERTETKLDERRTELADLSVPETDVESELAEAREALADVRQNLELLQSVYSSNKRVLDENRLDLVSDVERGLLEDTTACWVCGGEATQGDFESRLATLGERVSKLRSEAQEYESRVDDLEETREDLKRTRRRRTDLENEVADLERKLADRRESLDRAEERLTQLDGRIEGLAESVATENARLTEVESERKFVAAELDETRERLEELERLADQQSTLTAERESLTDEIRRLRNRKDELERRTREAFDEAIQEILPQFDTSFESARLTSEFDLVVAREGREASLDALSEGELELLGIVAALAGHEAFEVADDVPVLLLDSLGGLSDENLHTLVEYLRDRAPYLVFTAYPEHTAFDGHEIDPTEWRVVSNTAET